MPWTATVLEGYSEKLGRQTSSPVAFVFKGLGPRRGVGNDQKREQSDTRWC